MAISFNEIPSNLRVPFVYAEFDSSNAQQGPDVIPYKVLLIGQRLSAGTVAELTPTRVTSAAQAAGYLGNGSVLHSMAEAYFANNTTTETWAVALDDDGAHVAAGGSIVVGGTPTAAGTLNVWIAGRRVQVGVSVTSTPTTIATALAAAINAATALPVTATSSTGTVTLAAKHKGAFTSNIDVRVNYASDEALPAGVTVDITAMSGGTGGPDLTAVWAEVESDHFQIMAMPYTDSTTLGAAEAELEDRWGPIRQKEGMMFVASAGDFSTVAALGDSRNSQHVSIMGSYASPSPVWEWCAAVAGVEGLYANIDPARPPQTLPLKFVKAPARGSLFTQQERNLLLFDGVSTFTVDAGGQVRIERLVTTYKTNALGAPDISYLDVNSPLTLGYLRASFRNRMQRKYPRHKLANDGTRFGPGQAVATPKVIKAECVAWFRDMEELGLVEGIDQFKANLVVERNVSDPNRLDVLLPPDLINQLIVMATQFSSGFNEGKRKEMARVGGIISLKADGELLRAKGNFTYNIGRNIKTAVVGSDGVHGYKEMPQVSFIEGEITDNQSLNLEALTGLVDVTVTLELANGKTVVLREAWYAGEGTGNTEEGNIAVRFEGMNGEEVR